MSKSKVEQRKPLVPKRAAMTVLRRLTDEATYEDIMYELYVLQKVNKGLAEIEAGNTVSHHEVKQHLGKWLK